MKNAVLECHRVIKSFGSCCVYGNFVKSFSKRHIKKWDFVNSRYIIVNQSKNSIQTCAAVGDRCQPLTASADARRHRSAALRLIHQLSETSDASF